MSKNNKLNRALGKWLLHRIAFSYAHDFSDHTAMRKAAEGMYAAEQEAKRIKLKI